MGALPLGIFTLLVLLSVPIAFALILAAALILIGGEGLPEIEFGESTPKMTLIPNQHSVETLSTKRPYQTLDVRRGVGCAVRDRNPPNPHHFPQPHIQCRSTRYSLAGSLHSLWTTELSELPVVVVEQEFGLFIETGVSDLLFRPLKCRMLGHVEVDELSTRELHDDEHVKNTKIRSRVAQRSHKSTWPWPGSSGSFSRLGNRWAGAF